MPKSKTPSLGIAVLPIILMALLLGVGYGVYRIRPQVLLVAAAFLTGSLGVILKFSWEDMQKGIVESISKAMPAILIMLTVGVLIGSWMACGTIPMVIYYGLKLISPQFFLVTACLICSLTALTTGTSWGTVGTVGVAFIGIAMGWDSWDWPRAPSSAAPISGQDVALLGHPNLAAVTAGRILDPSSI
jgi:NhaC family Na+:H+ antiporter